MLRTDLELESIKLLQAPYPLSLNDNIYHEGNISSLPDFDVFSLEIFVNVINGHMVNVKNGI